MRTDADRDHQIAARAAVCAGIALTRNAEGLAVVDAGRNIHVELVRALDPALALAAGAGGLDQLASAAAGGAGGGGLHRHAHEALRGADLTGAAALGAGLGLCALGAAGAAALVAVFNPGNVQLLLGAEGRLLKGDLHLGDDVFAAGGAVCAAAAAGASAAEEVAEDVAQISEAAEAAEALKGIPGVGVEVGIDACEAVLVVSGPLIRVGQDLVGLVDLLEFILRVGLVVDVRMVFRRELAEGPFDLVLSGVFFHAENLVVISLVFACHMDHLTGEVRQRLNRHSATGVRNRRFLLLPIA